MLGMSITDVKGPLALAGPDPPSLPAMRRFLFALALPALLAACVRPSHVPDFAAKPFEPFNRADAVAIALREWRAFGGRIDDDAASGWPEPSPAEKPERQPGLWQRVGEYWWMGPPPDETEVAWTGKHDGNGAVFPASRDGRYAWSAAFISYVMRVAGAGDRFPYSANHATYVNAAAAGKSSILRARPPAAYAPKRGDLVCLGRGSAATMTFRDLPGPGPWPGHCAIVVESGPGTIDVVSGNVGDAVALTHIPATPDGRLADADGTVLDPRHRWFVVVEVLYDAEAEPAADQ
jgi:hypothetical protein